VTGLAVRGRHLWATTSSALWRVPLGPRGQLGSYWLPGGSSALQAVAVRGRELWLASEDRGLIRFVDGESQVYDRLAGLPTSWFVDVGVDARGRVLGATLQHGLVVLEPDADGQLQLRRELDDQWLMRVAADETGAWLATQAGPVHWPRALPLPVDMPNASAHAVLAEGDTLWIASESGLLEVNM